MRVTVTIAAAGKGNALPFLPAVTFLTAYFSVRPFKWKRGIIMIKIPAALFEPLVCAVALITAFS
jgi:hypothetical protein